VNTDTVFISVQACCSLLTHYTKHWVASEVYFLFPFLHFVKLKVKIYPCTRPWRSISLWDVEVPTFFRQSAHLEVRLSTLSAGRPLPPGIFLVLISVRALLRFLFCFIDPVMLGCICFAMNKEHFCVGSTKCFVSYIWNYNYEISDFDFILFQLKKCCSECLGTFFTPHHVIH
jgi:hypothetical protein